MYLKKQDFYYGAILRAILEYNPDSSMAMVERNDDYSNVYRIETNKSKKSCYCLFKHGNEIKNNPNSWQFKFSPKELDFLNQCHSSKTSAFIYFLCRRENLTHSEIAVMNLDEYIKINKPSLTIGIVEKKRDFTVARDKSPINDILLPRNRIEKDFDTLIEDIIKISNGYYCDHCVFRLNQLALNL